MAVGTAEVRLRLRFTVVEAVDTEARPRLKLAVAVGIIATEARRKPKLEVIAAGTKVSFIDQVEGIVTTTVEAISIVLELILEVVKKASRILRLQIGTSAASK